jgi:hypothetical protein
MILLGQWIRDGEGFLVDNLDHELFTSPNIHPIPLKPLITPQSYHILLICINVSFVLNLELA